MNQKLGLRQSNIRFYTNIILSGAIVVVPICWILFDFNQFEINLLIIPIFLSVVFFGRISLELALFIESTLIDGYVENAVKKENHYKKLRGHGNQFNTNWYSYLLLNDSKAAHDVIDHLADRLLFLLSSSISCLVGLITIMILKGIYSYSLVFILVIIYVALAFLRSCQLAVSLDNLRYILAQHNQ
jgi:hypothetical protein